MHMAATSLSLELPELLQMKQATSFSRVKVPTHESIFEVLILSSYRFRIDQTCSSHALDFASEPASSMTVGSLDVAALLGMGRLANTGRILNAVCGLLQILRKADGQS